MNAERWQKVRRICEGALECEAAKREDFLAKACSGDDALRKEVESYLGCHTEEGKFLEPPAAEIAAKAMAKDEEQRMNQNLSGQTIGHYRIVEKIGAGGMGEVYRATDIKLGRQVAIKVLLNSFSRDRERMARFEREAKLLATLNHPNITTIYDIDQHDGAGFIVMEYVAGKTLDEIIPRKGLKLGAALKYAVQIADALSKAHEAGIIHRDLKPGNVMVGADGQVKVLDFGLAKLTEASPQGEGEGTRTLPTTEEGIIMGTVAYMSPEQAEGKKLDARSDIFSFGSVLYEMVTGRKAFQENSKSSTLGAIIHKEPEPLGAEIPQEICKIITRCLRKDPDRRIQSMKDLKVELVDLKDESDSGKLGEIPAPRQRRRRWWPWAAASAAILLLAGALLWRLREAAPPENLKPVPLTSYPGIETHASFSPDGKKVAFTWNGEKGDNYDIYIKQIGSGAPPMRLTTSPAVEGTPTWSPDDLWIAFVRRQQGVAAIVLISPLGGPERRLVEKVKLPSELSWTPDGKWLAFDEQDSEEKRSIWAISIETGERRQLTTFQTTQPSGPAVPLGDYFPSISPDGRSLAFARMVRNLVTELYVQRLTRDLRPDGVPLKVTGQSYMEVAGITWTAGGREIVYAAGGEASQSLWRVSVSGGQTPRRLPYALPATVSPVIARTTPRLLYTWFISNINIWRLDTRTGERKMLIGSTYASTTQQYSPDGRRIAFSSNRSGNPEIWTCDAEGANCQQLTFLDGPANGTPRWSPDGRWLVCDSRVAGQTTMYVIPSDGGTQRRLPNSPPFTSILPSWSHDGRWIYFTSNRTGRNETWKITAEGGQAVQVTHSGGGGALESPDGKYIYYRKEPGLFRMPVEGGEEKQVLPNNIFYANFGITSKGVYFIPNENAKTIQFLETASGKVSTLATLDKGGVTGISVSPDDAYITWAQQDRVTTNLMLVEGFR